MPARNCAVSLVDDDGVMHTVEVTGSSLFEVASLALQRFQQSPWFAQGLRRSTRIEVEMLQPGERHSLSVEQLLAWSTRPPRSPQEMLAKNRVSELLRDAPRVARRW